jgi:hypothetical protein
MASQQIPQGNLNRLLSSLTFSDHPELNATAQYLGKGALMLALQGATTAPLETLTGIVNSPEPYQLARVTVHLLKTQSLANVYKSQIESNTIIGDVTCRTDSAVFSPYNLTNCSLSGTDALALDGSTPEYVVTVSGIYLINASLYT